MNTRLLCEIHFHEQEKASVYLESNCSGNAEKLGEIGLFVGFAMRMMSNLGNSELSRRLAVTLSALPEASAELAERDPGDVAVVDYPGYAGRKRFHSDFLLSDEKVRLIVKPKGFGFFARGAGYYAPVAALVLARYLAKKRRDDAEYRGMSEPSNTFALERCVVLDLPRITVTKTILHAGERRLARRDFARLSLGQQQSVLLALMLSSDSSDPLIIDQPEDNLDGEFIYHSLVPALRRAKERRQVIVVTHNANIAVLGDAEQVIALKSLSDIGKVVATGAIDSPGARDAACAILEGSEEAFRRRAQTYGIGLPAP